MHGFALSGLGDFWMYISRVAPFALACSPSRGMGRRLAVWLLFGRLRFGGIDLQGCCHHVPPLAPTGRNSIAKGGALGIFDPHKAPALRGRNKAKVGCSALSGLGDVGVCYYAHTRALPFALECPPFRGRGDVELWQDGSWAFGPWDRRFARTRGPFLHIDPTAPQTHAPTVQNLN